MKRYIYRIFILSLILSSICNIFLSSNTIAQPIDKVAVLPIQDLTHGANGVNFDCTNLLEKNLLKHGIKIINNKQIMSFLVKYRIRWTGFLDSYDIYLLGRDLKTNYILLGTICECSNKIYPRVSMTLNLINSKTSRSIWAWAGSLSIKDFIHPLGLFEPNNTDDLLPLLVSKAINNLPKSIEIKGNICPNCIIRDIVVRPRFIRSGQYVTCIVRINRLNYKVNPIIKLCLNNTFIKLKLISKDEYKATFVGPIKQGSFPLYLTYQIGNKTNRIYIGNITVDNKAPKVKLIARGIHLWNAVALKRRLVILPRLSNPEPISRWQIAVCTLDGEKILNQDGPGPLPSKFFWRGQDASGAMVATGVYKIVLDIWDMAGNKAEASIRVAVIRTPPQIKVSSKLINNKLFLTVKNETDIPLSFWRLEVFNGDKLVKTEIGSKLPATIKFFAPKKGSSRLYCIVTARDIFGNTTKKKFTNVFIYSKSKQKLHKTKNNSWITGF